MSQQESFFSKIVKNEIIIDGNPNLHVYLLRGLPGTGKSEFAKKIFK